MQPNLTAILVSRSHRIGLTLVFLIGLLLPALPAKAVFNGELDENAHPNVGIVFAERTGPHGGPPDVIGDDHCNGVLIAPKLVLTIAECVGDPWDKFAYVSFADDYDPLYDYGVTDDDGHPLLPFAPDFSTLDPDDVLAPWEDGDPICREPCYRGEVIRASASDKSPRWLAILRLDTSPTNEEGILPAQLPAFDSLDGIAGELVTSVGYNDVACEDGVDPWDCADLTNIFSTPFEDSVVPGRHIHLTERRFKEMEVLGVSDEFLVVDAVLNCDDLGGGYFDGNDTLVALTHNNHCESTEVRRLDTFAARNFLCKQKFAELKTSALCSSGASTTGATTTGPGKQSVDGGATDDADRHDKRPGKGKHKKGGKHQRNGKHGR